MADVGQAIASFEANIERQTGKSVTQWGELARDAGKARHGEIVAWLKADHALSHSHANHIAKRALQAEGTPEEHIQRLFAGGKEGLLPIYDQLVAVLKALGPDVELAPKKSNISIRRRKQFALVQPSTRTRLDLGLILPGTPASERLEPSGSFNPMFTHRVRIEAPDQIDAELSQWLKAAYGAAG